MIFQKIKINNFILLITLSLLSGCESWLLGDDGVLEYEYAGGLEVIEIKEGNNTFYEISGLCMSSSLNVKKVFSFQKGDSLIVEVLLTLRRKEGASGNFNEKIMIAQPIRNIYFGKKRKIIWSNS